MIQVKIPAGWKQIEVHIKGVTPLLCHNSQLCNPLNPWVVKMKEITSNRKKTEADFENLSHYEFLGGLYYDEAVGVHIPSQNIEGGMRDAAKAKNKGKAVTQGVRVDPEMIPLVYNGAKDPEKLWGDKAFVDVRPAGVNRNLIMRTRPIFREWELKFSIIYLTSILDEKMVRFAVDNMIIGDYRPKYGHSEIVEWKS